MLFDDSYNQIESIGIGLYKELGSKFIAYPFLVHNKKEVNESLIDVKKKEKSASHYCYAYVLNPDQSIFKINDDGEPSSTAGKPILTQIKNRKLTNILVVVVRYFGGKKLGIPGLIRSYKNATLDALQKSTIINKKIKEQYEIEFNHGEMNQVMSIVKKHNLEICNRAFIENNIFTINILQKETDLILRVFKKNNIKTIYKKIV